MTRWYFKCLFCISRAHPLGRLDFSLWDHEGEVKAWQGDFQQRHRDMFSQKYGVYHIFFYICIWSVSLLISFIFNNKFMLCICFIIIIDLKFVDFRFYSFLSWNSMANLVQQASVCIFLDLGFNFHLEFRQYKFTEVCCDSFQLLYQQIKSSLLLE